MDCHDKIKILLVEDNDDDAYLIEDALENRYDLVRIKDGLQAYEYLMDSTKSPNVILMDYRLPSMEGLEIIRKTTAKGKDFSFIVLTVDERIETAVEAMKAGALDFLPKANGYDDLPGMIDKVYSVHKERIEKKRVEEELKTSEEKLRVLFENSFALISLRDGNAKTLWANPAWKKVFGSESEYKDDVLTNVHPDDCEKVAKSWLDLISNKPAIKNLQYRHKIPNGEYSTFESSAFPVVIGKEQLYYVITHDITERKKAEEQIRVHQQQLLQADRMVSLGILVSGVTHEINNPNNFIMMNAAICKNVWNDVIPILQRYYEENGEFSLGGLSYTRQHKDIGHLISGISEGATRIQRIIDSLQDFARQDSGDMDELVNINAIVESATSILKNLIKKSTSRFSVEYAPSLPTVRGSSQQLEQVVINLITNSCHALQNPEKSLTISTAYDKDSDCVTIRCRDEGMGIAPENMKHIMDPFFTTKQSTDGTGLGLSVSYGIVEKHNGNLEFTSELGKGTTATVILPVYHGTEFIVESVS